MRKPAFCICENKDADQLRSYPEDRFSHNEAQIMGHLGGILTTKRGCMDINSRIITRLSTDRNMHDPW